MSKMVKLFKEHCVLLMSIGLMVSGFIYLFYEIITAVIENVNQTTCFLLFKKVTYGLIKYSNITEYKYNAPFKFFSGQPAGWPGISNGFQGGRVVFDT